MTTTTRIRCNTCRGVRHSEKPEGLVFATIEPAGSYANVADAVRQSTGAETAIPDWRCDGEDGCGARGGTKRMTYRELPEVLAVQLNRYDPRDRIRRSNARVPLADTLDLAAHLDPPAGPVAGAEPRLPRAQYRIRAVVCHRGSSIRAGHYTCWIRDRAPAPAPGTSATGAGGRRGAWILYDDTVVGPPKAELPPEVDREAHLVFYERVSAGAAPQGAPAGIAADGDGGQHRPAEGENATPELVETDGEEAPEHGEMNAVIRESSPAARRGKRTPGQDPIGGGEIVCDTEPEPPAPEPNAANPDGESKDVDMEEA